MNDEFRSKLKMTDHETKWPKSATEWARSRTQYVPIYRIHSIHHFSAGVNFFANWEADNRRRARHDRYSPPGTFGYYFGLTLEAAEDEARHYGGGSIDPSDRMILVMECCFDDILYLTAGVIHAVWSSVGLPAATSHHDMYLKLMHNNTVNEFTDAIGLWVRNEGFRGLIYPSARYGQQPWLQRRIAEGYHVVPAINLVDLGSHICRGNFPITDATSAAANDIKEHGGLDKCVPILAEPNIVLFDDGQITGQKWGVVYQTFPLAMRQAVLDQDDHSRQARSYVWWSGEERPSWLSDDDPPPYRL